MLKKNFPIFLAILALAALFVLGVVAARAETQEGYRGVGHDTYHAEYYQNWISPALKTSVAQIKTVGARRRYGCLTSVGRKATGKLEWMVCGNGFLIRRFWMCLHRMARHMSARIKREIFCVSAHQ